MDELILEPLSINQKWRSQSLENDWEAFLTDYLETLAKDCLAGGAKLIGHIKAIALFPDHEYFQISVVSPAHPASYQGQIPDLTRELSLSLNVIVYGLAFETLHEITCSVAHQLAIKWNREVAEIEFQRILPTNHTNHHHDKGDK